MKSILYRSVERHILLACALIFVSGPIQASDPQTRYREDIAFLASDELGGRGLGTAGLEQAADWIEQRLAGIGLEPLFEQSFRQSFPVKTGVSMEGENRIEGLDEDQWVPFGFSSSGHFDALLVFVGYGMTAAPLGFDELSGQDLSGKAPRTAAAP